MHVVSFPSIETQHKQQLEIARGRPRRPAALNELDVNLKMCANKNRKLNVEEVLCFSELDLGQNAGSCPLEWCSTDT